jgi:hypothetical protein
MDGAQHSAVATGQWIRHYIAPTAREISKTTIVSEIKIWIIVRIFAQRASNGASVGPNVELWVKATKR